MEKWSGIVEVGKECRERKPEKVENAQARLGRAGTGNRIPLFDRHRISLSKGKWRDETREREKKKIGAQAGQLPY